MRPIGAPIKQLQNRDGSHSEGDSQFLSLTIRRPLHRCLMTGSAPRFLQLHN